MRPGFSCKIKGRKTALGRTMHALSAPIYEVRGHSVKLPRVKRRLETDRSGYEVRPGCCWRAREAWDCSARMRSASVPPPSGTLLGAAPLAVAPLTGFAALAEIAGSAAASMVSIGEF